MPLAPENPIAGLFENLKKYLELRLKAVVLRAEASGIATLSTLVSMLPMLFTALLFIILGSISGALALGQWLGSQALGFLAAALGYCLLTLYFWWRRKHLQSLAENLLYTAFHPVLQKLVESGPSQTDLPPSADPITPEETPSTVTQP